MKKFTKICLIGAAVFLVLGLGFLFGGIAAGGTWRDVVDAAERGAFSITPTRDHSASQLEREVREDVEEAMEDVQDDIEDLDNIRNVSESIDQGTGEITDSYDSITKLDIEMKRGGLYLVEGKKDVIEVEITGEHDRRPTMERDGKELKIRDNNKHYRSYKGSVTIYCPRNVEFDEIDISVEGGETVIEVPLTAREIDVEIGAGSLRGRELITARKSSWHVGAGEIIVDSIAGNKLDFECGAGVIDANVKGSEKDYNYDLECAVGEVSLGSTTIAGIGQREVKNTSSDKYKIDAECGMGTINVDFKE